MDEQLIDTIGTIYDAALEPDCWYDAVRVTVDFVGGERGMVGLTDTKNGHADASYFYRLDPAIMQRWEEEFESEDPWADGMTAMVEGDVGRGSDLISYQDLERRPVFREICVPVGAYDTCWTALASNRLCIGWLSAFQAENKGPFSMEHVERMAVLGPHLVRTARIHARFIELRERTRALEGALDQLSFGLLTCTADARVVTMNRRAEELFQQGGVFRLSEHRLSTHAPATTDRLRGLIAEAASTAHGRGSGGGGVVALARSELDPGLPPLAATVAPVSPRVVAPFEKEPGGEPLTLVMVTDPEQPLGVPEGALGEVLGLTPAEARLALALARGQTVAEYASQAGISEGTARWTLKKVQAKTETTRQGALVSLVLRAVGPLAPDAPGERERA